MSEQTSFHQKRSYRCTFYIKTKIFIQGTIPLNKYLGFYVHLKHISYGKYAYLMPWGAMGCPGVISRTVLVPLFFSLNINDISTGIDSEIRLFTGDCVCCREVRDAEDP